MAARTIPVIFGVVSRTLLNRASSRKEIFCSQILRSALGQRRLSHFGFLSGGAQYRAALKPFARQRDRANRAPAAPEEGNRHEDQNCPPRDPHEDDAEVVASNRCADQPCQDGEDVPNQHHDKDRQLRVAAFQCVLYEGIPGKFDLCHNDNLCSLFYARME